MLLAEFDRQVETLVHRRYPEAAGLGRRAFLNRVEPLRERLPEHGARKSGRIPFVIVVRGDKLRTRDPMGLEALRGQGSVNVIEPDELASFSPIEGVQIPDRRAYLLLDVDTGVESLNVTPDDALQRLVRRRRSPLTVDEGLAVLTHYPDILKTHNAFSMLASRRGDRRVPALWTSKRRPKLGWCWAGNPHTWLGSASSGGRVAA
jgi:hypothetical protein